MAGEGILSIGATVDKTGVESGLASIREGVKVAVQSVAVEVEETTARTKAAWNKLSDDIKVAAQGVSAESLKVAEATKAQTAALADLRRASVLARDAKLDDVGSSAILAAAQEKVTATSAALSTAKQEEAAAVAAANEEEQLSENALVAAFQRAALSVRESLSSVQEKVLQTAETAGINAEGITAGFAGLTNVLGAGIAAGFIGEYIDGLARINVELDHLSAKTGIAITELAGLQQIMKEAGGDFETVATGIVRMQSNVERFKEGGSKELALAFANLGISAEAVRNAKPDELLQMIATAMARESDANIRANSAIQIFGRGGQALIPILREQGAQLTANMHAAGQLTGVTDESAEAARRWTQDVAKLSAEFRSVLMPVMEHAEDVVRGVMAVFDAAAALIVSGLEAIGTSIIATYAPVARFGVLLKDVFTGNWVAIKSDVESTRMAFVDTWASGFEEIKRNWQVVGHDLTHSSPLPPRAGSQEGDLGALTLPGKDTSRKRLALDEEQLNQARLAAAMQGYRLGNQAELNFWQEKLTHARKGSEEYRAIVAKLAELQERQNKIDDSKSTGEVKTTSLDLGLKVSDAGVRDAENNVKELRQAYRDAAEEKIRAAQQDYADIEKNSQFDVQMGRITAEQRLAILRDAAAKEAATRAEVNAFLQALDLNDQKQYEADIHAQEQATRELADRIRQINQQAALESQKIWQQFFREISSGFNQIVSKWIIDGGHFRQMMQKEINQVATHFLQMTIQMAEQWAKQEILKVARHAVAQTQVTAIDAAGTAAGVAIQKSGDAATGLAAAKSAAKNTYKVVSGWPVVGPILAPILAAGAFAAVEAFDAGGVVGQRMGMLGMGAHVPILAEAGERVLTPSQTANFDRMVNQTSNATTVNAHFHDNSNYSAIDGASVAGMARRNTQQFRREMMRELRRANAI